jgi:hypothetical protein
MLVFMGILMIWIFIFKMFIVKKIHIIKSFFCVVIELKNKYIKYIEIKTWI